MLAPTIAAAVLASAGGLHLAPGPVTENTPEAPAPMEQPSDPAPRPVIPGAVAAGILGLVVHASSRRRRWDGPAPGDALGLVEDPIVVFVGGHGTDGASAFATLIDLMDLDPGQTRFFDYRWVVEGPDPIHASETASIDATADALNAYLAGLAVEGRPIYLIGFSKGGAGIAELLARWDEGSPVRVPEVRGAALLDPPLASGLHGELQSLGRLWGPIPDDGGYDPIVCGPFRCRDRRSHLGEASGVEVLVIRNPKAGITNFNDHPEGLRVYDVADAGPGPLAALLRNPFTYAARASEAHNAVLSDARVAACLTAEIEAPGTCDLSRPRLPAPPSVWEAGSSGFISVV